MISRRQLIILGMHRSGTSALTGLFNILGAHVGNTLLSANQFNPNGYYESEAIVREHDALLSALGRSWSDERPMPLGWIDSSVAVHARSRMMQIFKNEFTVTNLSVMKDPRICRILPLWQDIFMEMGIQPVYLITLRAPNEVISSLQRRDGIHEHKAALLYVAHLLDAERDTRGQRRLIVEYSDLLQDWAGVLLSIQNSLRIELPALSDEDSMRIGMFLNPDLRHFVADQSALNEESRPLRLAHDLHRLLCVGLNESTESLFDNLRAEFEEYLSSLEPWLGESNRAAALDREILNPGKVTEAAAGLNAQSVLYFDIQDRSGYSEKQSLRHNFSFGADRNSLRFVLSEDIGRIRSLRLDITDRPAFCEFQGIWIDSPQGARAWHSQVNTQLFEHRSLDMKQVQPDDRCGVLWIVCMGYDPHAVLIIPDDILAKLGEGWVIGVDFVAMLPATAVPKLLDYIERQANISTDMQESLLSREQELECVSKTIEKQITELNRQSKQIVECRNDIIRAQAQIELLKEMLLTDERFESI